MLGTDLSRDLYYLGLSDPGVLAVLTLATGEGPVAPLFTSAARAASLLAQAPAGTGIGRAPAGDPRARVELLEACLLAGAERIALDPGVRDPDPPGGGEPAAPGRGRDTLGASDRGAVRPALAYVRSLRSERACL